MSRQRITAIEYIRGVAMLGVVGIHTGAYSLANPDVNVHLFALLEIVSRFSVPIFFFVSAFGLFLSQPLEGEFHYGKFMQRRFRMVLIPYLVWSILYMLHYTLISGDESIWKPTLVYKYFLFGLASYQLYFLVILLWFYTMMPLWRSLARSILGRPLPWLGLLLFFQLLFNYYSSYQLSSDFSNHYLSILVQYRQSYWVFHYLFIFMLGALCAARFAEFAQLTKQYRNSIVRFFWITGISMLSLYYYLLYVRKLGPEAAVNIAHQLNPIGVLYTIAAALFLFSLFHYSSLPTPFATILTALSEHSYPIYLVHPFMMYYLTKSLLIAGLTMSTPVTIFFYLTVLAVSLLFAVTLKYLAQYFPFISILLAGKKASTRLRDI